MFTKRKPEERIVSERPIKNEINFSKFRKLQELDNIDLNVIHLYDKEGMSV